MPRYFTKPARANDDDYWPATPPITTITVDEHVATDTGLRDADGNTVWRAPRPVGFGRDGEW